MPTVRQILAALEEIAPKRYAFSFDKVGLQVGDPDQKVERAVVTLDRSLGAVEFAKQLGAQFLLAHHPLIFRPIESVDSRSHVGRTILQLVQNNISFAAAHTNWDSARGGINDTLAEMLGLAEVKDFGFAAEVQGYKLVTTCLPEHSEMLIDALSEAGAGIVGAYSRCASLTSGHGTFTPGGGSDPLIGQQHKPETVYETRIEMAVAASVVGPVLKALRRAHPYEEPTQDLYTLKAEREQPAGRIGTLNATLQELAKLVEERLDTVTWAWGDPAKRIKKVAVVGGAADDEWIEAQRAGADVLITGEVK
ncbi:MAG TPA: Nif3-like dinuclear metal center hexameric protein, partial [Fimbriimonas sp.]|nr:Nif3-like dinuclear metal center hexameric protein [Fimbriimonas sp.]